MRNMDFWDNSEILSDNENEKTRKKVQNSLKSPNIDVSYQYGENIKTFLIMNLTIAWN